MYLLLSTNKPAGKNTFFLSNKNTWQLPPSPGASQAIQLWALQVDHDDDNERFSDFTLFKLLTFRIFALLKCLLDKMVDVDFKCGLVSLCRTCRHGLTLSRTIVNERLLRCRAPRCQESALLPLLAPFLSIAEHEISFFIGPESDHWLCLSLTD